MLCWREADTEPGADARFVDVAKVSEVKAGKGTAVFKRQPAEHVPDSHCFSLVDTARTLDLVASSEEERNAWVAALRPIAAGRR